MRLSELMKKHQIKEENIKNYFDSLGWIFSSINKKITKEEYDIILETHNRLKKNSIKSNQLDILPEEFNLKNPFEIETLKIMNQTVDFDNRENRVVSFENSTVESFLTDFEAFSICNGLKDNYYKKLSQKFFSGVKDCETLFLGHQMAMQTIEKYGRKLMFYLINLPPLPFKATNSHQIFSELDKKKSMTSNPVIRLLFDDKKIQFSFYKNPDSKTGEYYSNILVAKYRGKTKDILFLMSRDGRIIPQSKNLNVGPIINTFISYSKDLGSRIINYGKETGECSICGRILSDTESVRLGIGPICRDGIVL